MNNIPRALLVVLALVGGLIFIYAVNPPYTACTAQNEVLKQMLTPYLYLDPKEDHIKTTGIQKAVDDCKKTNNSGGCFNFFEGTLQMLKDLKVVTSECTGEVYSKSEIKNAIVQSLEFMVALPWGLKAPASEFERDGWYDSLNKSIFCDLKSFIQNNYKNDWSALVDKILNNLPTATELTGEKGWREEAWKRSVLATPCAQFG